MARTREDEDATGVMRTRMRRIFDEENISFAGGERTHW